MDKVNHPGHYNTGKIEVIDFIEDQKLGFHLGNAVKYICRAGKKDGEDEIDDINKAIWYLERYRNLLEEKKKAIFVNMPSCYDGTINSNTKDGGTMLLDKGKVICEDINSDVGKVYLSDMMKNPAFAEKYLNAMAEETLWNERHRLKEEKKSEDKAKDGKDNQ